jgi:hypothetical protein
MKKLAVLVLAAAGISFGLPGAAAAHDHFHGFGPRPHFHAPFFGAPHFHAPFFPVPVPVPAPGYFAPRPVYAAPPVYGYGYGYGYGYAPAPVPFGVTFHAPGIAVRLGF